MTKNLNEYKNYDEAMASINEGLPIAPPKRDHTFIKGFALGLLTAAILILIRRYVG